MRSAPSESPRLERGQQLTMLFPEGALASSGCFFEKTIRTAGGSEERRGVSESVILHLPGIGDRKVATSFEAIECPSERMAAMGERQELAQRPVGLSQRARRSVWREVGTVKLRQGRRSGGAVALPAPVERDSKHAPASGDASLTASASQCMAMIPSTAFHSDGRIRRWWATRTECSAPSSVSFQ